MRHLVGKTSVEAVPFMDSTVNVKKLSYKELRAFQELVKDAAEDETKALAAQRKIIRIAVEGADTLTDDELDDFPVDDLSKLSASILEFSGLKVKEGNA